MSTRSLIPALFLVLSACSGDSATSGEGSSLTDFAPPEGSSAAAEIPKKPAEVKNVILVTIDTLRADYLSAYGGRAKTPVLDRLAAQGWLFEECISTSMLTNPSHASIMTSLYPRDHGVHDNESGVENGMRTIASAMQKRGMKTGAVINFPHLNPNVANLGQGFDEIIKATRDERRAPEMSRLAIDMMKELEAGAAGAGVFMWVHYTDPHAPYDPPAAHPPRRTRKGRTPMQRVVKAAPGFQRKNPWFKRAFRKHQTAEQLVAKYVAEIEATDAGFGHLIAALEARAVNDTMVVVTSDHGENMGEHNMFFHHGGLYRPTVHVPLIVKIPGKAPGRFTHQVSTVDIAPTILEAVGAGRWEPMRGESLVAMADGRWQGREYTFSEHMKSQMLSVRSDAGTLILHRKTTRQFPSYPFKAGRRELYDRTTDPRERKPQPAAGDLGHELDDAMQTYLGLGLRLTARQPVAQDREALRALGYIE